MKLIINGDDFGITRGCNLAIIDCFEMGLMTSASLMTNMPYASEAAEWWKNHPERSIGLHLNLTVGKPLTPAPKTLIKEDGTFNKKILHAAPEEVSKKEIEDECRLQMEKFIELTGRLPEHINSHHGIEAIPFGAEVLQKLAVEYNLPIRQLTHLRHPENFQYETNFEIPLKIVSQSSPGEEFGIINAFSQEDLESDRTYELVGHPGYVDWDLLQISSLTNGRCIDAKIYRSPALKRWVEENDIELVDYRTLSKVK